MCIYMYTSRVVGGIVEDRRVEKRWATRRSEYLRKLSVCARMRGIFVGIFKHPPSLYFHFLLPLDPPQVCTCYFFRLRYERAERRLMETIIPSVSTSTNQPTNYTSILSLHYFALSIPGKKPFYSSCRGKGSLIMRYYG